MIYVFDLELPNNKSIVFAITYILGIGKFQARFICKKLGFAKNLKLKDLSKDQVQKLVLNIQNSNLILADELKKLKSLKFKELRSIKSYRGLRLKQGLPVRGQRTHTNARTARKRK